MPFPDLKLFVSFQPVSNSFDQDTTESTSSPSTSIPKHNNHHFRDSSTDSSDSEDLSTTPTTPISSTSNALNNNNNNNNALPNLQRRSSESTTEVLQFKKLAVRRNTLPSRINPFGFGSTENSNRYPWSRYWDRDTSVQVAMENVQFGL